MAKAELRDVGARPEGRLRVMAPHAFGSSGWSACWPPTWSAIEAMRTAFHTA
jgi:hypothetical protein